MLVASPFASPTFGCAGGRYRFAPKKIGPAFVIFRTWPLVAASLLARAAISDLEKNAKREPRVLLP